MRRRRRRGGDEIFMIGLAMNNKFIKIRKKDDRYYSFKGNGVRSFWKGPAVLLLPLPLPMTAPVTERVAPP